MECNGMVSKTMKNPTEKISTEPNRSSSISLLEGEEIFFNRILSRDSSKGFSSRIYYRVAGTVPFHWEEQPGKPKITSGSASLPLLSPPPAVLSSRLPPNNPSAKDATRSRVWFWKRKSTKGRKNQCQNHGQSESLPGSGESTEFWCCEGESMTSSLSSPRSSSSFSSSSSLSPSLSVSTPSLIVRVPSPDSQMSVKGSSRRQGMEGLEWVWSCTPWGFSGVMVGMVKGFE